MKIPCHVSFNFEIGHEKELNLNRTCIRIQNVGNCSHTYLYVVYMT